MQPMPVTTIEQAIALPYVSNAFFDTEERLIEEGPDIGDTVRKYIPRKIYPAYTGKDQILFFNDHGKTMQVVYTENGPAKTEAMF